jgi:hypothetical protein
MSAISRRPWDLVWLGLGAALLLLSALPVHADSISALEGDAALGLGVGAAVRLLLGTRTATLGGQPRRPHQATV